MSGELLLGVEGGATRTTGVLADGELRVIAEHAAGPTNLYAVDRGQARAAVDEIVDALRAQAGDRWADVAASAFCIAGIRNAADRDAWWEIAAEAGAPGALVLTHDAAAGLAAGSDDLTGVLVVCGTGSLVYGRRADGRERFVGGRGPILGDEGSGFDIGRRGLRAAARSADGRGPTTALERLIPERLGAAGLEDLPAQFSPFAKDRVAAVAPIVFDAAAGGDDIAARIIAGAAAELVRAVAALVRSLWPPNAAPRGVVLSGGVLRAQADFRRTLASSLAELLPETPCRLPALTGPAGAARLAQVELHRPGGWWRASLAAGG